MTTTFDFTVPQPATTAGDTRWFQEARFGLFLHWGAYADAARHEWMQSREMIDTADYERRYVQYFNPDLYNPDRWAELAERVGMKYFVITTKHHDGFCLWDSKHTDFKAPNSPAGRDLLRPMIDAFRSRGFRTGFYHSLIDWHHPHFVVDYFTHPLRNALPPDDAGRFCQNRINDFARYRPGIDINAGRDQGKYADYLHAQVRELLTEYGPVDILWFDFSYHGNRKEPRTDFKWNKGREAWKSERLLELVRELAPNVIMNDRLDLPHDTPGYGDVHTPEQFQPPAWVEKDGKPVVWEACQTFSGAWGFFRDEHGWRSAQQCIFTLIDCVSKGGNLLLNIGPTGRGVFDARAVERLEAIADWMQIHQTSIHGCTQAPKAFATPRDCRLTYSADRKKLYVHLLQWPYKHLLLQGPAYIQCAKAARFLHDHSDVPLERHAEGDNLAGHTTLDAGDEVMIATLPLPEPVGVDIPVIEIDIAIPG